MTFVLAIIIVAALVGFLSGGSLSPLLRHRVRLPGLVLVALGLQLAAPNRVLAMAMLFASFALLLVFTLLNRTLPGMWLVMLGLTLNLTVITVNQGMPVSKQAIAASDQLDSMGFLLSSPGVKHHLATADDRLRFLGDVIPLGPPIRKAISVGDIATYLGVAWFIVSSMRGRRRRADRSIRDPRRRRAGPPLVEGA
jgi:hypothetical protein